MAYIRISIAKPRQGQEERHGEATSTAPVGSWTGRLQRHGRRDSSPSSVLLGHGRSQAGRKKAIHRSLAPSGAMKWGPVSKFTPRSTNKRCAASMSGTSK